jgi:hypothetical protein
MRTSGASTETTMTLAVIVVATIIAVYLLGGPGQVLFALEQLLRSLAETVSGFVRGLFG